MMPEDARYRFRVDLHVHTRRYSPCAEALDPAVLCHIMASADLDGLVITEHDAVWPARDIAVMNQDLNGRRIYRGVEVSSRNGHFIVIGLDQLEDIRPGIGIHRLIAHIHARRAAIIWAHPHLKYRSTTAPLQGGDIPHGVHAVEVASGVTRGGNAAAARALARDMGCATVGGSDAHAPAQVGCAYTLFAELPENEAALAAAIRNGSCKAGRRHAQAGG